MFSAKAPAHRQRLRSRRPSSSGIGAGGTGRSGRSSAPPTPGQLLDLGAETLGLQPRTRRISRAICSPRSSCRKCAAPSIFTCSLDRGDPVDEALARLADRERPDRCRRRPPAPASPSGRGRRRPRASCRPPGHPPRSGRAAGTGRRPPWTRRSGTARRSRRRPRPGAPWWSLPWITNPTGRSGFFSAKSRHAMNPFETRPVKRPVLRIASAPTRSAFSIAQRSPIGPPQSWTTTIASFRSSAVQQLRDQLARGGRTCTSPGRWACPSARSPRSRGRSRGGPPRPAASASSGRG